MQQMCLPQTHAAVDEERVELSPGMFRYRDRRRVRTGGRRLCATLLAMTGLVPSIVGRPVAISSRTFGIHGNGPAVGLERRGHWAANPFRQRALDIARESAMECFGGHSIADFDGGDI